MSTDKNEFFLLVVQAKEVENIVMLRICRDLYTAVMHIC